MTFPRDGFGHGDMGTAFLLALLAASELAGKKIVRVGVGMVGGPNGVVAVPGMGVLDVVYARQRREMEFEQYLREQGSEQDNPFTAIARMSGRLGAKRLDPRIILP
jgi:hypothetical protein